MKSGAGPVMRILRPLAITVAVVLSPFLLALVLWTASFPIWQSQPECGFGTVSASQYRALLNRADRQPWSVWPGLSQGVFAPSNRSTGAWGTQFEQALGARFRGAIDEVAGPHPSGDAQLAAAHAVMRSIGASLVRTIEVAQFPKATHPNPIVYFRYFLPQRRLAPACLSCFFFRYTTISVDFAHDLMTDTYKLHDVIVLLSTLDYDPEPGRERNITTACPAFPSSREKGQW